MDIEYKSIANNYINIKGTFITKDTLKKLVNETIDGRSMEDFKNNKKVETVNHYFIKEIKLLFFKFFLNNFFNDENNLLMFFHLVSDTFKYIIKLFKEKENISDENLHIIFIGDLFYKNIATETLFTLPNKTSFDLGEYFSKYFENETFTIDIYLNPQIPNYEIIHKKLEFLCYSSMNQLKYHFYNNKEQLFEYFIFNRKYKLLILRDMINKANKMYCLNDSNNKLFYKKIITNVEFNNLSSNEENTEYEIRDVYEFYENNKINKVSLTNNSKNPFYIDIYDEKKFHNKVYRLQIGALFDVSNKKIPVKATIFKIYFKGKDSILLKNFFNEKNYTNYKYIYNLNEIFFINSFKFSFIIDKLEYQLFNNYENPWENLKYERKLSQLLYFYFIDMMLKIKERNIKKSFILKFKNTCLLVINKIQNTDIENDNLLYEKIIKYMKLTLKDTKFNNVRFFKLYPILLKYSQSQQYRNKYFKFAKNVLDNITIFDNILTNIDNYCKTNKLIEEKIYKGLIEFIY